MLHCLRCERVRDDGVDGLFNARQRQAPECMEAGRDELGAGVWVKCSSDGYEERSCLAERMSTWISLQPRVRH